MGKGSLVGHFVSIGSPYPMTSPTKSIVILSLNPVLQLLPLNPPLYFSGQFKVSPRKTRWNTKLISVPSQVEKGCLKYVLIKDFEP